MILKVVLWIFTVQISLGLLYSAYWYFLTPTNKILLFIAEASNISLGDIKFLFYMRLIMLWEQVAFPFLEWHSRLREFDRDFFRAVKKYDEGNRKEGRHIAHRIARYV